MKEVKRKPGNNVTPSCRLLIIPSGSPFYLEPIIRHQAGAGKIEDV